MLTSDQAYDLSRVRDLVSRAASTTDEAIVAQVLAGDVARFEILMRRHNAAMHRAVRGVLHVEADVEEIMQDAYLAAFHNLAQFAQRASFRTWLLRIAVNAALARARRSRIGPHVVDPETLEGVADEAPPADRQAIDARTREVLEAEIDCLPPAFRVVFMLREIEGLEPAAVSEVLGISVETVRTRHFRAREKLRAAVEARFSDAMSGVFDFHETRCCRVVFAVMQRLTPQ